MTQPLEVVCFAPVNGRRMRVTKVDNCGRPVPGQCSTVVTGGFVTATLSGEVDEGEEIEQKNAAGELCVSVPPCPTYKWTNAEIEFCQVNPALANLFNPNWRMLSNAAGKRTGYAVNRKFSCSGGFALEIWTDLYSDADLCDDPNAEGAWGYFLVPWMSNGFMSGDLAIANASINFTFSAKSKVKSKWGAGPYPVELGAGGSPGYLYDPVQADEDYRIQVVDVEPPEDVCGCSELVLSATTAVAGTPGHFLPNGAVPPPDLAAMDIVVAQPTTDWTPGQYVVLGDASQAHYDGGDWLVGPAS